MHGAAALWATGRRERDALGADVTRRDRSPGGPPPGPLSRRRPFARETHARARAPARPHTWEEMREVERDGGPLSLGGRAPPDSRHRPTHTRTHAHSLSARRPPSHSFAAQLRRHRPAVRAAVERRVQTRRRDAHKRTRACTRVRAYARHARARTHSAANTPERAAGERERAARRAAREGCVQPVERKRERER